MKKMKKIKNKIYNIYNYLKKILYNTIYLKIENLIACYYNFKKWKSIICIDNQYDFVFLLAVIKRKLELIEQVWGDHTNHENDYDEKEKLKELINLLNNLIDIALENDDVSKNQEYQKLSKSFFNKLHRLHDKLWD